MNYEGLSDHEREQFDKVALEHIGNELQTLISLRTRIVYALALLKKGAERADVIAVLSGEKVPYRDEEGV